MKILLFICLGSTFAFLGFNRINDEGKVTPYEFPELRGFREMPLNSDNSVTNEGAKLGRFLFYDSILSLNHDLACATCHQQQYAFGTNDSLDLGSDGKLLMRNTPALFNLAWYDSYFWDGRAPSIESQINFPITSHSELNISWSEVSKRLEKNPFYANQFKQVFPKNKIDSTTISYAIAQFERTIISHNSKFDKAARGEIELTRDEFRGFELLNDQTRGNCMHCHTTDSDLIGTTGKLANNGLPLRADNGRSGITNKPEDLGKFKIPSLRNLQYSAPYMHDGRFKTIEEVIDFYSIGIQVSPSLDSRMHLSGPGGANFTKLEKYQIIQFLNTLNDSTFISDSRFNNPFTTN